MLACYTFFSFFLVSVIEISESRKMNCFYLPRILHFFLRSRLLSHFFLCSLPLFSFPPRVDSAVVPRVYFFFCHRLSIRFCYIFFLSFIHLCLPVGEGAMEDERSWTGEEKFSSRSFLLIRRTCSSRMEALDGVRNRDRRKEKVRQSGALARACSRFSFDSSFLNDLFTIRVREMILIHFSPAGLADTSSIQKKCFSARKRTKWSVK